MTLARWREFYEIEVTPMSLIFAAIVLILVCTHHHHVLFPLWIHVNTLNCYMVHLLIFEKDPLEPKVHIGMYDQSWKGFPRKSPISANITHVL